MACKKQESQNLREVSATKKKKPATKITSVSNGGITSRVLGRRSNMDMLC